MPTDKTNLNVHRTLRSLFKAWTATLKNEINFSAQKTTKAQKAFQNEKYKAFNDFRSNIDPRLQENLRIANSWIKSNHEYIYWNSIWTNTCGYDELLQQYHGIGCPFGIREKGLMIFSPCNKSPKQLIMDGYKFYVEQADKEIDILAAGGISTECVDALTAKIKQMLESLKHQNEDLT